MIRYTLVYHNPTPDGYPQGGGASLGNAQMSAYSFKGLHRVALATFQDPAQFPPVSANGTSQGSIELAPIPCGKGIVLLVAALSAQKEMFLHMTGEKER